MKSSLLVSMTFKEHCKYLGHKWDDSWEDSETMCHDTYMDILENIGECDTWSFPLVELDYVLENNDTQKIAMIKDNDGVIRLYEMER